MVYSLEVLCAEYRKGHYYKFLFFWGHTPSPDGVVNQACLSQWWMQDFTVDGVRYVCAEQYMMAQKARLFSDEEMLENILQAKHPKQMKNFGRKVKNFDEQVWRRVCYEIVLKGSIEKFRQNQDLLNYLFKSEKRILVEASPVDKVWGIGLDQHSPDAGDPLKWQGLNLLGFALTQARDILLGELPAP